jgi:hypothetical protein
MVKRNEARSVAAQRIRTLARKLNLLRVPDNAAKDKVIEMATGVQSCSALNTEDAEELKLALAAFLATWDDEAS